MAQSAPGITVDSLQHVSRWFTDEETLKAASRRIVDYHHRLDLSSVWGDDTVSSSDGQRFQVEESTLLAGFYPRYFGYYDRAITVYTHTSDQSSVFGSQAISCSVREALYVLDGLLANDTILRPREHFTDTYGFTEQLFAICFLLGYSFMPRLKDLKDQQLYRFKDDPSFGSVDSLLRGGFIDELLIREQWDPMARVAVSLRDQTAPAHVILRRLASSPKDRLSKAITALGRLLKTTYILQYLHDDTLRERVHSPTESWRVAAPICPAALLREPGSVQERRLRRDHEQGQRVEPAIERCPRMEHRPDRGPGRWTRGPRRSRLSRDVGAGLAARPPPHHPERNLPISGPAGSLRVIFHTVAAQTPTRRWSGWGAGSGFMKEPMESRTGTPWRAVTSSRPSGRRTKCPGCTLARTTSPEPSAGWLLERTATAQAVEAGNQELKSDRAEVEKMEGMLWRASAMVVQVAKQLAVKVRERFERSRGRDGPGHGWSR